LDYNKQVRDAAQEFDDTKSVLLGIIGENPGIWYREIMRMTGMSNGTLAHHLRVLEEAGRIKVQRLDHLGKTRYFSVAVSDEETGIIGCAKNSTAKEMMLLMLDSEFCTFNELVEGVGKSPSTVSWHLKRLVGANVVRVRNGEISLYSLADRSRVLDVLSKYKESLLDAAANNYADLIDEL
jgi:predicted transcriptional regulator